MNALNKPKPATAYGSDPASNIEQLGGASIVPEITANLPQTSSPVPEPITVIGGALDRISSAEVL
jgi:hypothetical protein